ncbi:C-type lectin lectoxin-Phi2-like [Salvelinus alpinus]|uniref:C-type lectin lectoxin-Phi2-like n=1 Tax=Salvelinus alpinus TaxID=8036 RepID=UPI0039FD9F82
MSEGVYEIPDRFEDDEPDAMKNTDIDGQIYSNVRDFKPSPRDGVVASVHFQWWKRPSGIAAVFLGLLCVLLLAGIIGLSVYYGVIGHHYSTERDQLQARVRFYEKPCLAGWWKFGTSCYYLSSTMNTAGAGQKECRTMDGELVVINSREEQIFIHEFKKNVWIGTYKEDGIWQWVDNTSFTTTYWMEGEPNNMNDKVACVEISQTATDPLKSWKGGPCVEQHWVCEKPITE